MNQRILFCILAGFLTLGVNAQQDKASNYSYLEAFKTQFYNYPPTETRSASGKPGHKYWQNKADYVICLWDQNVFKGAGTHSEVTFAYYHGKPIYLVNKLPINDLSGWIMSCASEIVNDFESLKILLNNRYNNGKHRT